MTHDTHDPEKCRLMFEKLEGPQDKEMFYGDMQFIGFHENTDTVAFKRLHSESLSG